MERQNCFWTCLSLNNKMETYPTFPTVLMKDPATRLFTDLSFSDVFYSVSFGRGVPPLVSENRLPKVETFLQKKSFPSQNCQTRLLNAKMVLQTSRVGEALDSKILTLRPWKKDLRSMEGALGNCEGSGFVLQHSLEPAFCLQAAKSPCSTWWSQTSQKAAGEGSAHLICHQPLFFFQNNAYEKHTWSQICSNWQTFLFGSSLMLNKHKI